MVSHFENKRIGGSGSDRTQIESGSFTSSRALFSVEVDARGWDLREEFGTSMILSAAEVSEDNATRFERPVHVSLARFRAPLHFHSRVPRWLIVDCNQMSHLVALPCFQEPEGMTTCLLLCLIIATLTTYRVQTWLTHYSNLAPKMVISAYDEHQRELPFPLVTLCNINPARGLVLYNPNSPSQVTRGVDYELFSDAVQGRVTENPPKGKLEIPIYRLMDQASHQLVDMLKLNQLQFMSNPSTGCHSFVDFVSLFIKNRSSVAPFRCLAAMPHEGGTRAGILPGSPKLDSGSRVAEVGFEPRTFRTWSSRALNGACAFNLLPAMHISFSNPSFDSPLTVLDLCTNLSAPACNAQLPTHPPPKSSVNETAAATTTVRRAWAALILPSGGMAARHRKSVTAEQFDFLLKHSVHSRSVLVLCSKFHKEYPSDRCLLHFPRNPVCHSLISPLFAADVDEFQLTLDPQSYDYMIPNQGFVGFRILLHGRGDPLWGTMPGAVYAGPTFHTMLRVVGLKKANVDEFQLTLDPQSYDYMIPNQGFVGFRILLHGRGDPLWGTMPGAVYAGPTFHTMLRVVRGSNPTSAPRLPLSRLGQPGSIPALVLPSGSMTARHRKGVTANSVSQWGVLGTTIYRQHCVPHHQWAHCMHQCMQEMLYKQCHCYMSHCTLLHMMQCGRKMHSMVDNLPPSKCRCKNPCEQVTYSIESITQALKPPLFSLMSPRTDALLSSDGLLAPAPKRVRRDIETVNQNMEGKEKSLQKKEIKDGFLIQLWAFLRESNRTAFEEFRHLSRLLQSLHMDLQIVERAVSVVQFTHHLSSPQHNPVKWDEATDRSKDGPKPNHSKDDGLCLESEEDARMLSRVRRLGEEFVRLFRQSVLFRDLTLIPGEDFHIHMVRLFFLRVVDELDHLASQLQHNDLFSDVTMLDLQRKAHQCKQTGGNHLTNGNRSSDWLSMLVDGHTRLTESSGDIASLQAVLLATDTQFKQLRSAFVKLTTDNQELIELVPIEQLKRLSSFHVDQSLVTITIQLTRDKNRLVRLESVQSIYNPLSKSTWLCDVGGSAQLVNYAQRLRTPRILLYTELFDIIISGLVLAFLALFFMDMCFAGRTGESHLLCCSPNQKKSTSHQGILASHSKRRDLLSGSLVNLCESSTYTPKVVTSRSCPACSQLVPSFGSAGIAEADETTRTCDFCSVCPQPEWSTTSRNRPTQQSTSPAPSTFYCLHHAQAVCEENGTEYGSSNKDTDSGKPSSSTVTHTPQRWDLTTCSVRHSQTGNRLRPPDLPLPANKQSPGEKTFGNDSAILLTDSIHTQSVSIPPHPSMSENPTTSLYTYSTDRQDRETAAPHMNSFGEASQRHTITNDQPFQAFISPSILNCTGHTSWTPMCECVHYLSGRSAIHHSVNTLSRTNHNSSFNTPPGSNILDDNDTRHVNEQGQTVVTIQSPSHATSYESFSGHTYSLSNVV
ncbi:hypothetical protein T265_01743 [Opisthorchis viverrini]|uniref:Amiloride-sensitive sodium channel n=1 Tax=Opisthorchis viverrini TaxID=6198 RepID=A0A074ZYH1_OPIVI|nr:hypothetical protein T265_01743 [Opisthorchis viverrini]KER32121.1 hypothetical protein T265_01743 [Opisthorchis viverrini]